jgi:pyruvate dehydrogenase E1 component alpha subunit/2-oxoisovalerate dehydrogenase E1 component alpha subunit
VIAPAIRNLGALLLLGARPADVMMQYMAKAGSPTGGREQNVHFSDFERGWIGLISHLGVMVEVMAGVALSFRLRDEDRVALVYIGDGGASTGAFHEGLSLAAAKRAPLIVIVENNGYAYSTPVSRQTAAKSFVDKAPAYGVIGDRCDGNDVMAVYGKVRSVAERVRAGEGPALLEMMTYRRLGHAEHDNQHYVPAGEIESWEARDPIARFEQTIRQHGWLEEAALAAAREKAKAVIDEAREEAESSPMPDAAEAMTPVFAGLPIEAPWTRRKEPDPHRN